jgi:hypothetical protein
MVPCASIAGVFANVLLLPALDGPAWSAQRNDAEFRPWHSPAAVARKRQLRITMNSSRTIRSLAILAAASTLCVAAAAQSLMVTQGEVLAASGGPVPGVAHALYPASTTNWVNPVVDETGNVMFCVSSMTDDGTGLSGLALPNNRAYLRGSTNANLSLMMRASDAAPLVPGCTLNTATGPGPSTGYRMSADGRILWGSWLSAPASSANDNILYVGTPGNWQIVGREGDPAAGSPGVAGCTYASASAFNSPSQTGTALNTSGAVLFKAKLQAGDVTGTTNDDVWYVGQPAALQVMLREGDPVGSNVVASLGFTTTQMNSAGQVLHDQSFSTTLGAIPATAADNVALLLYTPGSGNSVYLREGSAAPGTAGATFNNAANTWSTTNSTQTSANNFNSSGEMLCSLQLLNGDVTAGVNDMGLYLCSPSGQTLVLRRGDAAPGIAGTTMDTVQTTGTPVSMASSPGVADNGVIAFRGRVIGGTSTAVDDTGLWAGLPGSLNLIYREGDVAPGTGGLLYGDAAATVTPFLNANGFVLFQNRLAGVTDALFLYDANTNATPQLVCMAGDSIEVLPGVFKTVSGFGNVSAGNCSGAPMMFGNDNTVALRVTMTDNTNAVMVLHGYAPTTTYCTAGTTTNGCNASISGTGIPSASSGSGYMIVVSNAEGAQSGILFYGINGPKADAWGAGSSFLCVKSPLERTGVQSTNGTAGLCDGSMSLDWNTYIAANPLALGVPFSAGDIVWAQGWFRDPPAPKTTSLSNALTFGVHP